MYEQPFSEFSSRAERPAWDEFWFVLALFYSVRGTCDRLRTACLLVDENNRLVGAGYNGSLAGEEHCDDVGHFMVDGHCFRTLHAEENAILHSTKDLTGCTAYILDGPCLACAKKLLSKGIKRILFTREFNNVQGKDAGREFIVTLAEKRGVEFRRVDIDFELVLKKMLGIIQGHGGRLQEMPNLSFVSFASNQEAAVVPLKPQESANTLRVERMSPFAKLPTRAYPEDAGLDLYAAEDAVIMPGEQAIIGTGLRVAVPPGYAGFVWDKSGLAAHHRLKTAGGVLDSNYRGELKVILLNLSREPYHVRRSEKIAQLVIKSIATPAVVEERIGEQISRGPDGFGSTGIT